MSALAALLSSLSVSTLDASALGALYFRLPKNESGLLDLKSMLAIERAIIVGRGGAWDVEQKLEQLEVYPNHEAQIENGFDRPAFCWAIEQDLQRTHATNDALIKEKANEAAAEAEKKRMEEEQEEEDEENEARAAAAAAAASAAAHSLPVLSIPSTTTSPIRSPVLGSVFHSMPAALTPSAGLARHHGNSEQVAELEALYERQSRELEHAKLQLRGQLKVRSELNEYTHDAEQREAALNEAMEIMQIKIARERQKTKQMTTAYEAQLAKANEAAASSSAALTALQSDHDRLLADHARLQSELTKSQSLVSELTDQVRDADQNAELQKASLREKERLEKKLQVHESLLHDHAALQTTHAASLDELAHLTTAYEQLHEAYCSEEQLYKDAANRVQQLQQIVADQKAAQGELSLSTNSHALSSPAAAVAALSAPKPNSARGESLRDDLLDSSDTHAHDAQPSVVEGDEPSLPVEPSLPNTPSRRNSIEAAGSISPATWAAAAGVMSPLKRHSLTFAMPAPKAFTAHADNATAINFHFFQLVCASGCRRANTSGASSAVHVSLCVCA